MSLKRSTRARRAAALAVGLATMLGTGRAVAQTALLLSADIPLMGYGLITEAPKDYAYKGTEGLVVPVGFGTALVTRPSRYFEFGLRADYLELRVTTNGTRRVQLARAEGVAGPVIQLGDDTQLPIVFGCGYTEVWAESNDRMLEDRARYQAGGLGFSLRSGLRYWFSDHFAAYGAVEGSGAWVEGTTTSAVDWQSGDEAVTLTGLIRLGIVYGSR